MCSLIDIEPILSQPPFYIQEILKSSEKIYLVYNKISKKVPHVEEHDNTLIKMEDTITLDLTGNPLEVDLNDVSLISLEDDIWLQEENNHYPIPLNAARKVINKFNKNALKRDETHYIFCVCDGTDRKCTLVLGACQTTEFLSRIEIYNKGCYKREDTLISLENMKQEHLDNTGIPNWQTTSVVLATYIIYGNNIMNNKISTTMPINASISYNVSWNAYQYQVPDFVQSAEMIVQIVIGHIESGIYAYWEELVLLQSYAKQLITGQIDLDKFIQAGNSKNYIEISKGIVQLLDEIHGHIRIPLKRNVEDNLNLEHLRQEDLIDKLWKILILCYNTGELRLCFHFLFEELVSKEFLEPVISNANKSTIAIIINEISKGKLAVPTISVIEALEYLVELGIEKLKHDYCYILKYFNCLNQQEFEKYWNQLSEEYVTETKCEAKYETKRTAFKRIRSTIQQTSLSDCKILQKINYLMKMHVACEFLLLCDNVKLATQESFNALMDSLKKHVLNTNDVTPSKNMSECMLQEIRVKLKSNDVKFLQSKDPVSWNVRLTSTYDRSIQTTIFHHSLKPLFPPCIYNKYDNPVDDDTEGPYYYVSKLVNFTEKV